MPIEFISLKWRWVAEKRAALGPGKASLGFELLNQEAVGGSQSTHLQEHPHSCLSMVKWSRLIHEIGLMFWG